jgi:soluble lytic murein transglycosylase-like protein
MAKKRRRLPTGQRRLDFQPRSKRKGTRTRRAGRLKFYLGTILFLAVGVFLLFTYWKYSQKVLDLRVSRAYGLSKRVLKQTQRPSEEQERYAVSIARNSVEKGLNPAVVAAIVVVESGGNPLTVSPSGDLGLMQVNARIHAKSFDFEKRNLLNPEENIAVGTSILKTMLERHGDDKAIAAYNGLLPDKREYSARVHVALSHAGLSPETQLVSSNPSLLAALSDWMDVVRVAN